MALAINPNTAKGQAYYKKKYGANSEADAAAAKVSNKNKTSGSSQSTGSASSSQRSSTGSSAGYNSNNTDYMALMEQYEQAKDYLNAAKAEQARNAKIDAQGLDYEKTYKYSNLYGADEDTYRTATDSTDYQRLIDDAVGMGDYYTAAQYEQQRNAKIDAMNQLGLNPNGYGKSNLYAQYLNQQQSVLDKGIMDDGSRFDYSAIMDLYQQMQDAQHASIDYNVQKAIAELQRAQEDAQKGYEAQRNQVNIDEAQARDRQVLYAAARGDRGGITARQYDSISNTAANNRRAIAQQQQQLATDTARQIVDLRAQGEFQKAEAVLQIAQQQLAQLWELQQYEDSIRLQEQQLAMSESALTGIYKGNKTYEAQQAEKEWEYTISTQEKEWARQVAMSIIETGNMPNDSMLESAGMLADKATYQQMADLYKAQLAAKSSSGGGGGTDAPKVDEPFIFDQLIAAGKTTEGTAKAWLIQNGYTAAEAAEMAVDFMDHLATMQELEEQNTLKVSGQNRPKYDPEGKLIEITVNGNKITGRDTIDRMLATGLLNGTYDSSKNLITYYMTGIN